MNIGMVSMRYAKALFGFATEAKVAKKVYDEMEMLSKSFLSVHELKVAFHNPLLSEQDKYNLLVSASGGSVVEETGRFFDLVLKNKREKLIQYIALLYRDLYQNAHRISIGKLTTAFEMDKTTEEHIKQMVIRQLKGYTIQFNTVVDPNIEGGFILDIDTYRIDASIANQFERIKKQFIEKNKRIV